MHHTWLPFIRGPTNPISYHLDVALRGATHSTNRLLCMQLPPRFVLGGLCCVGVSVLCVRVCGAEASTCEVTLCFLKSHTTCLALSCISVLSPHPKCPRGVGLYPDDPLAESLSGVQPVTFRRGPYDLQPDSSFMRIPGMGRLALGKAVLPSARFWPSA
jgi:hypothetical protein